MYEPTDIDAAVESGVISELSADRLRKFTAAQSHRSAEAESLRFTSGFADLFAASGIVTLFLGLASIVWRMGSIAGFALAIVGWLLAEYFARARRMRFSANVLAVVTIAGVQLGLSGLARSMFGSPPPVEPYNAVLGLPLWPIDVIIVASATAFIAWLFWKRHNVAFAMLLVGLVLYNVPQAFLMLLPAALAFEYQGLTLLVCGLAAFACGIWWDMTDVYRETTRSDVAFWLHLLGGFTLANVAMRYAIGLPIAGNENYADFRMAMMSIDVAEALSVLAVYVVFVVVSLAIDRRALLMASLVFSLMAIVSIIGQPESRPAINTAQILMSGLILLLVVYWTKLREWILDGLPTSWRAQLPRNAPRVGPRRPVD